MASATNAITAAANAGTTQTQQTGSGTDRLANKEVFLQLLVAQIRNQDPLNPADGTQFLSQLAQFSDLEQAIQMRTDLDAIRKVLEGAAAGNGNTQGV